MDRIDTLRAAILSATTGREKLDLMKQFVELRNQPKPLLAPNGKPSKLNAVQYAQVRTPEFKAWFGDFEVSAKNNVVNEQIEKYAAGTLPANVILDIGKPSSILLQHGIPNLPITLRQSIIKKAVKVKHEVDISDLKDIALSIQSPIAIFNDPDQEGTRIAVTEIRHTDGNIIAAIRLNVSRDGLEINDIKNIHPKRDTSVLRWIEAGDLLGLDKEKGRSWIENLAATNSQQPQSLPAFDDSILYDASSVRNASKIVDEKDDEQVDKIYEYFVSFEIKERIFKARLLYKKWKKPFKNRKNKMHSLAMDKVDNSPTFQANTDVIADGYVFDLEFLPLDVIGGADNTLELPALSPSEENTKKKYSSTKRQKYQKTKKRILRARCY
jgi:hypothetical protein